MDRNVFFLLILWPFDFISMQASPDMLYDIMLGDRGRYPATPPRSAKKKKADGFFEPYWPRGDWVYYRKSSTAHPNAFYLNKDPDHIGCDQVCPSVYTDYGIVCGMRLKYDDWTYEYKVFDSMCFLELENCQSKTATWHAVRKGNCSEVITTQGTEPTEIVSRMTMWGQRLPPEQ